MKFNFSRAKIPLCCAVAAVSFRAMAEEDQVARGANVYKTTCITCHGEKFDGNGPAGQYLNPHPRNLVTDPFKNGDKPEQILKTVTDGLKGTGMASFATLPEADRKAVVAYIVSLRKKK